VAPSVLQLPLGEVVLPPGHPQAGASLPIVAYAIAHRDGVLLLDTGVGMGNAEVDDVFHPTRVSLEEALGVHGMSLADVTAVANCHLHFDHAGRNASFKGVPIFAQEREYRAIAEPDYTVREWVEFDGARYELLDGEAELAPGVRAIATPGHSPGHQSLVVATDQGLELLAGQALLTVAEWEGSSDPAESGAVGSWDDAAYDESVGRLRRLDPDVLHLAHDRTTWRRTRS
jgi:N-acyl homoserine lactone hydrolase